VYITAVQLDYGAMAFLRLGFWSTLECWASVYYLPHLYMLLLVVLGNTKLARAPREKQTVAAAAGDGAAGAAAAAGAAGTVTQEAADGAAAASAAAAGAAKEGVEEKKEL
jgi:hypothetical protein